MKMSAIFDVVNLKYVSTRILFTIDEAICSVLQLMRFSEEHLSFLEIALLYEPIDIRVFVTPFVVVQSSM